MKRSGTRDGVTMRPVPVVVGGLPATRKSTIARILAEQSKAPYLRVDRIEHEIVAWSRTIAPTWARRLRSGVRVGPGAAAAAFGRNRGMPGREPVDRH